MARKANALQMGLIFDAPEQAPREQPVAVAVVAKPKRIRRGKSPEPRATRAIDAEAPRGEEADGEDVGRKLAKQSQPGNLPLECIQCGRVFGREEARFVYEAPPGRVYVVEVLREDGTRERPRYVATCLVAPSPGQPTCRETFRGRLEETELDGPARKQDHKGRGRR